MEPDAVVVVHVYVGVHDDDDLGEYELAEAQLPPILPAASVPANKPRVTTRGRPKNLMEAAARRFDLGAIFEPAETFTRQ